MGISFCEICIFEQLQTAVGAKQQEEQQDNDNDDDLLVFH